MGVYSYDKTRISKKTGKRVKETWYYYNGKYTDVNTGERIPYKKRGFKTKKDAVLAEQEFLLSVSSHTETDFTFAELSTVYLQFIENRRKTSSIVTLETHLEHHLLPFFGKIKITKLRATDFINFQNKKRKEGYSISYIDTLMNSARKILYHAVHYYGLHKNPAANLEPLKEDETIDVETEDEKIVYWTLEDYNKVMDIADDPDYKYIVSFLYMTGLRKGEAAALCWKDIDLKSKKLKVTKTLTTKLSKEDKAKNLKWKITTPKTKNSIRTLSLNKELVAMLIKLKKECMQYDGFNQNCFVFGLYRPMPYTTLDRKMKVWAVKANVPIISPHGLRHSHISFLINHGINILAIAKRAGDTVDMILKRYAHLFKETEQEIINLMDDYM